MPDSNVLAVRASPVIATQPSNTLPIKPRNICQARGHAGLSCHDTIAAVTSAPPARLMKASGGRRPVGASQQPQPHAEYDRHQSRWRWIPAERHEVSEPRDRYVYLLRLSASRGILPRRRTGFPRTRHRTSSIARATTSSASSLHDTPPCPDAWNSELNPMNQGFVS